MWSRQADHRKETPRRECGQKGKTTERRFQMDSGTRCRTQVVPPQPKCVAKRTQGKQHCLAPWDIPEFGSPFLDPLGALIAGCQKRCGAKDRVLQPFGLHRSGTSSGGVSPASNG